MMLGGGGLVLLAIVGLVIWVLTSGGTRAPRSPESAEAVLKRRYASGEVTKEEYEQRLADLRR